MLRHRLFSMGVLMNSVTVDNVYGHDPDLDEIARLPGEGTGHAGSSSIGQQTPAEPPDTLGANERAAGRSAIKSNAPLYAGVGLLALLMAGGYVYHQTATSHHHVRAAAVAAAGPPTAIAPLAPSASLANVRVPHLPPSVVHQKYLPQPPSAELSELDSLRAGTLGNNPAIPAPLAALGSGEIAGQHRPATQAPARPQMPAGIAGPKPGGGASGGFQAAQSSAGTYHLAGAVAGHTLPTPGSVTAVKALAPKAPLLVATAVGAKPANLPALPAKATIAGVLRPSVAPASGAAVTPGGGASLAAAQAGTLSAAQQTSLYQLVTQLGTLERNDEIRQAALAGQVQQLTLLVSGKMADYDRRLSMLEAQTAVSGAMQAASSPGVTAVIAAAPPPAAPAPGAAPPALSSSVVTGPAIPAAQASSGPAVTVQYHVQAASPGLAMLSAVGGNGAPLEVQAGDIIPGYGKVLGVVQQGDSWIVQTQSGNIE
ncbi:MAG: hypothetical protein B7Z77_05195 [Acidocella sp. 20-58-15]|nr:MAG: hypothetical protein B7Z77_05195 [Acidocella sp. 20-58-15]